MTHEEAENRPLSPDRGSRALPDATGEGEALLQQIAEVGRLHQFDLGEARAGNARCICGEEISGTGGVDVNLARHQARAVLPLVEAQVAPLRDEIDHHRRGHLNYKRMLREQCEAWDEEKARADAAESALRQVRELHGGTHWCFDSDRGDVVFEEGTQWWPCPTLAILDSARVGAADTQPEGADGRDNPTCSCGHTRWPEHYTDSISSVIMCAVCLCKLWRPVPTPTAGSNGDTAPEGGA